MRDTGRLAAVRTRRWAIVAALSASVTVSWGVVYYAFAVFLAPMQAELGFSAAQLTGAFSVALLVSAVAGIAAGRHLDRHGPRVLMTGGAVAGTLLVLAWSQVQTLTGIYAIWTAMGLVMATVLYEPAFTVLAKHFPDPAERRRAMTAMTLVGALASFIFLPLSQVLVDAYGWRDALVVLSVVLGVVTIPLHLVALGPGPAGMEISTRAASSPSIGAGEALRSRPFWLLSIAFFLASFVSVAATVHTIPFLIDGGHSAAFAAFAVGLIGVSQIPGRLMFGPLTARLPRPHSIATLFGLIALGVAVLVSVETTWAAVSGLVLLGMGNGMVTLARATSMADLYGARAYGTIAGAAAAMTTGARAAGPIAGAMYATAVGYSALLWSLSFAAVLAAILAFRAEHLAATTGREPPPDRPVPSAVAALTPGRRVGERTTHIEFDGAALDDLIPKHHPAALDA